MDSLINIGLILAYIMFFVAVATLLMFPIISLVKGNTRNSKSSLVGIGVLILVVIVAYILSPADQGAFYTKMGVSAQASKIIGAGLISTYFIFAGFVLITLYTVVAKWFK
jgi:hypothetical protein